MTKQECIDKKLIADLSDIDECVISEFTRTFNINGKIRNVTCTGSDIDELVRGIYCTEGPDRKEAINPIAWTGEQVSRLAKVFLEYEGIHTYTSAAHMAILAKGDDILCVMEDISRHSAIDKAIGYGILHDTDLTQCMIYSSGRVQADTVHKLVNAGVPILISKSVPTLQAIELAKDKGITIIGKAWPDGYKVFT